MSGSLIEPEILSDGSGRWVIHLDDNGKTLCGKENVKMRTNALEAANCEKCLAGCGADRNIRQQLSAAAQVSVPSVPVASSLTFQHSGRCHFGLLSNIRPAVSHTYIRLGQGLRCMEIGCEHGSHARDICEVLRPSRMVCVDPWVDLKYFSERYYASNLNTAYDRLSPYKNVEFIRGFSHDVLPALSEDSFDFVYIDGDHSKSSCVKDIRQALRLVRVGGIVAGHDYMGTAAIADRNCVDGAQQVFDAVQLALHGCFVDALDSDWWIIVTSNVKRLAMLDYDKLFTELKSENCSLQMPNYIKRCWLWDHRGARGPIGGHDLFDSLPYPFEPTLTHIYRNRDVLELGPGNGRQYERVVKLTSSYCIADIAPSVMVDPVFASASDKFILSGWEDTLHRSFDVIHFWYVLHHIRLDEMLAFFRFIARHLRQGGLVAFNLPELVNVQGPMEGDGEGTTYSDPVIIKEAAPQFEVLLAIPVQKKSTGYVLLLEKKHVHDK